MDRSYSKNEFPTLTTISGIFMVIGILVVIASSIGILLGIIWLSDNETETGIIILSASITGLLYSLLIIGFSELIKLFIRIEYNTRRMSNQEDKQQAEYRIPEKHPQNNMKTDLDYKEWMKVNPGKSINDYYSALNNK